jgi:dCTP deaminase
MVFFEILIKTGNLILTAKKILDEIARKNILIEPYREECLGPNSYDVHLGRHILTYSERVLDARERNTVEEIIIPTDGFVLQPNTIYLGVSEEYTETHKHVPLLKGISSVARLGIVVNSSSGIGSVGHCNTWTMEITVIQPVRVYHGMPIAQLLFFEMNGEVDRIYHELKNAKYSSRSLKPVESMMWKNKF